MDIDTFLNLVDRARDALLECHDMDVPETISPEGPEQPHGRRLDSPTCMIDRLGESAYEDYAHLDPDELPIRSIVHYP